MSFYVLRNPIGRDDYQRFAVTELISAEPMNQGDAPSCPRCGTTIGLLNWLPPYRVELEVWSKEYGDIAFGVSKLLISERVKMLYEAEGLSGLEGFHEVEIVKITRRGGSRLRTPPPKYYCVSITRSRAVIDAKASELVMAEPNVCEECRNGFVVRTTRVVLEEGTWSGEDVFIARGLPGTHIASQRFKDFFDRHNINNGVLIPAAEYSFDFYPGMSAEEVRNS